MKFKKIAVLTSEDSWFVPYAHRLSTELKKKGYITAVFENHSDVDDAEIVFVLSYFQKIPADFFKKHTHTLIVHESDLPKGRGWSPLFWQILEGENEIPIVLFGANEGIDKGDIYLKDTITLEGHELHNEIREKQADKTIELCLRFLSEYENIKPVKQEGGSTSYDRRSAKNSRLDV